MLQRPPFVLVTTCILFLMLSLPGFASATDDRFALRLWGQVSPFLSGDAGNGAGAPHYKDALNTGLGVGAEFSWRFSDRFGALAGIGYEKYSGDSYMGISFDDLKIVPVYLGGTFHFIPKRSTNWDPYLRMDIGAAHFSSVDVSYQNLKGKYWDSSWAFLFAVGAGIEYRWEKWGASLEGKFRYMGRPDSGMGTPSKADPSWTVPIALGINYHF
jgi:opacity protein-like surface antigen